ncbi:hypothetical protein PRO82_000554 [Candidatus Protochlamydia amoebophila]|nr:hypothetical protein [Candidatus Protochlamydia amoebophila]
MGLLKKYKDFRGKISATYTQGDVLEISLFQLIVD